MVINLSIFYTEHDARQIEVGGLDGPASGALILQIDRAYGVRVVGRCNNLFDSRLHLDISVEWTGSSTSCVMGFDEDTFSIMHDEAGLGFPLSPLMIFIPCPMCDASGNLKVILLFATIAI